ncbi:MAG: hypothetical protein Q4F31_03420 [Eubacteriales bacterium]|nr:hypothetical protein [Eubacteriales bacterium]
MAQFCDKVLNIVSLITQSGFSSPERRAVSIIPIAAIVFLVLFRGPFNIYYALLRRRIKTAPKGEITAYALFCAVIAAVVISGKTNGEAAALTAMLVGGCTVSPGGGIGLSRILDSFALVGRSIVLKGHPDAVVVMRRDSRILPDHAAMHSAIMMMRYFLIHLVVAFVLSFETADFAQALLLSAGAVNGSGLIMLLCIGEIPGLSLLSGGMKLFLAVVMLLGRLTAIQHVIGNAKHVR